jgi:hypothetical protein
MLEGQPPITEPKIHIVATQMKPKSSGKSGKSPSAASLRTLVAGARAATKQAAADKALVKVAKKQVKEAKRQLKKARKLAKKSARLAKQSTKVLHQAERALKKKVGKKPGSNKRTDPSRERRAPAAGSQP